MGNQGLMLSLGIHFWRLQCAITHRRSVDYINVDGSVVTKTFLYSSRRLKSLLLRFLNLCGTSRSPIRNDRRSRYTTKQSTYIPIASTFCREHLDSKIESEATAPRRNQGIPCNQYSKARYPDVVHARNRNEPLLQPHNSNSCTSRFIFQPINSNPSLTKKNGSCARL